MSNRDLGKGSRAGLVIQMLANFDGNIKIVYGRFVSCADLCGHRVVRVTFPKNPYPNKLGDVRIYEAI